MSQRIPELFTWDTRHPDLNWASIVAAQNCTYLHKNCVKTRKSQPELAIGTCSVGYGTKERQTAIICPHRFLERRQIFLDCLHLLTFHEPGNELHVLPEIAVPGGSVDYVLASVRHQQVVDFVGIELQAVDTTGTVWPARQQFLAEQGLIQTVVPLKPFGINWKMTAKTTLVQLHHKTETFELLHKRLVLVLQDCLFAYMQREFRFSHIKEARLGDALQFHIYNLDNNLRLNLSTRKSTDATGVALSLGLQTNPHVSLEIILAHLQARISERTLLTI